MENYHGILKAIAALLAIAGTVFGAARLGVSEAVRVELNYQIEHPRSPLNRQIRAEIDVHDREVYVPRWEVLDARFHQFAVTQARIETKLDLLKESINK